MLFFAAVMIIVALGGASQMSFRAMVQLDMSLAVHGMGESANGSSLFGVWQDYAVPSFGNVSIIEKDSDGSSFVCTGKVTPIHIFNSTT